MKVKLTHPFIWRCPDPAYLFNKCNKLNTFLGKLEKQVKQVYPEVENETEEEKVARVDSINAGNGAVQVDASPEKVPPIVTLVGPIKIWWSEWDSLRHKEYTHWRDA